MFLVCFHGFVSFFLFSEKRGGKKGKFYQGIFTANVTSSRVTGRNHVQLTSTYDGINTCGMLYVYRCLGKARLPNNEIARTVCLDYTMAGAKAFHEVMKRSYEGSSTPNDDNDSNDAHKTKKRKFRFVYLSGAAAERDQTKPLWFMQEYRRIRVSSLLFSSPHPPFFSSSSPRLLCPPPPK